MRIIAVLYGMLLVWLSLGRPTNLNALAMFEAPDWVVSALPGVGLLLVAWIERLGSNAAKEVLIFWRLHDRLPGHRAFKTKFLKRDTRINVERLKAIVTPWPNTPAQHNTAWYALLQKYDTNRVVEAAHLDWLTFRELTWMTTIGLVIALGVGLAVGPWSTFGWVVVVTFVALALTSIVARHAANQFVWHVLAVATTDSPSSSSVPHDDPPAT